MSEIQVEFMPKQIVRGMLPGEFMPFYSIDELLRGVCHIVRKPAKKTSLETQVAVPVKPFNKSSETRRKQASARFDVIKEKLEKGHSNIEIAGAVKVTVKTVQRYIAGSLELQKLAQVRPEYIFSKKGGPARFRQQEAEIRKALKTEAFWFVAKRFRFCQRTLKRHLEES